MKVQAYVFLDTENPGPKRIVAEVRKISGVVRADALFGRPDVVAIVEGDDIASMDAVIDRIVELPGVWSEPLGGPVRLCRHPFRPLLPRSSSTVAETTAEPL